ncbi:MAG: carboxyl-terminal processing protease [Patescibacteria group bacterium]|nr:carboxyl-terminal processing protease [Patescibacteria group bacterium]
MQTQQTKFTKILTVALLVGGFFVLGLYIGGSQSLKGNKITAFLSSNNASAQEQVDLAPFWKAWNTIDQKYPGADKVTDEKRLYSAIQGLMSSLDDPYSVFFPPEEAKEFNEEIAGSFSGVGMEIDIKDDVLTVISPLKDTPAYKAGIKAGDKILKIDNTSTQDITSEKAKNLIRGEKGTTVTLVILHEGDKDSKEIKIVRDTIAIPTLDTELRKDGIFVIKLYSFSANSLQLFKKALSEFTNAKTDKLVLDLRGNPGGYLNIAVDMASFFIPSGKTVVSEDYGSDKEPKVFRSAGYNPFGSNLKFVVLIDGGSASASEIVAGALQDYGRALLVGTKSYGKGSVQEVVKITGDTMLKITVAKWLTPKGTSISEKGLTPDYEVGYTKEDAIKKVDPQMNKAVQILKDWNSYKK